MPTLRTLTSLATGLYRDLRTGRSYRREELLADLSPEVLDRPIRLGRVSEGVYSIYLAGDESPSFQLWSRRRVPR